MRIRRSLFLVFVLLVTVSYARVGAAKVPGGATHPASASIVDNGAAIDINQIRMVVTNTGSIAFEKLTAGPGLEYPRGSGKTAVFAAGLWLGAQVAGGTRVAISDYSDEYQPGSVFGGVPDDPNGAIYHVYKLNRVYADSTERDAALADYVTGAMPGGAPPVALLPEGSLGIMGDQMLWAVYNDASPAGHTAYAGQTAPLGVEIQQTTFAFDRPGALGTTVFVHYKIINRGSASLSDMYAALWSDPDLGAYNDDLVGCDSARALGYAYNATNADQFYGATPPAMGYMILSGPSVNGGPLGMTAFEKLINGSDPTTATQAYHLLQGLHPDGSAIIDPLTTLPTTLVHTGDPVAGTGWLDEAPSDRRLMLCSGPFEMSSGDVRTLDVALVVGQGGDRLSSIVALQCAADGVRQFFEQGFQPPYPTATCDGTPTLASLVDASAEPGRVTLSWYGAALIGSLVTLERKTASTEWRAVDSRSADGLGAVTFEDRDVATGTRYGYRIAMNDHGATTYSNETWIDVPVESRLALAGFRPNPSVGDVFVDFSLASAERATLRVFDITGRRVFEREVSDLGPGRHLVRIDGGGPLRVGAYVLQLSQGGRTLNGKAVVVR